MSATIIAASAGGVVEQIGSYAGYASIVGLGVLALLYFTQAREVRRLREWAGRAPERAVELEQRVQADAQKRVVAQPIAAASAAGQQSAEASAQAAAAAVYASIGAQPPGAPPRAGQLARPSTPSPAASAPGAVPRAPDAATLPAAAAATQTPAPAPPAAGRPIVAATPPPAPASSPAAGATPPAASTAAARIAADSRSAPALAHGSSNQDTAESDAARPQPLPESPSRPAGQLADDDGGGFGLSPARIAMIVGGGGATILVAVVLMITLASSDEKPPPENSFGNTPSVEAPASTPAPSGSGSDSPPAALTSAERRATDVAVLNGTTQTGLARSVGDEIEKGGFRLGSVATNPDQSVPTTIVAYSPGHEEAALAVAKIIGVERASVRAADASTTAAADVVVTVGADKLG